MRGLVWRCGALLVAAAVVCSGVLWGCGAVAVWCFAVGGVLLCAVGCCGWWVVCLCGLVLWRRLCQPDYSRLERQNSLRSHSSAC